MANNSLKKPILLVILDGFGVSNNNSYNAVYAAKKPNIDKWLKTYPNTLLHASGQYVGLLPGFIGNSEVGHSTIGCGRIIKQPLAVISQAIEDKSFFKNNVLLKSLEKAKKRSNRLHIMGLLSDGGVHSHIEHLYAFLLAAKDMGLAQGGWDGVYVHAFLDGRDVGPKTASKYLGDLDIFMKKNNIGVLASVHGRFYAMDRDNNWDRTSKIYKILTGYESVNSSCDNSFNNNCDNICEKNISNNWQDIINNSYANNITDEFILPTRLLDNGQGVIKDGDGVIFFNFRPDRAKQITNCFVGQKIDVFESENIGQNINTSCFVTPVEYDKNLKTNFMFGKPEVSNTLKDVLISNNKTIFSIAETEKYAHVTYFFNGGISGYNNSCDNNIDDNKKQKICPDWDKQVMIKSKILDNYSSCPAMSAAKITETVIDSLNNCLNNSANNSASNSVNSSVNNSANNLSDKICRDFYLINYANADMVGHSGNFNATVKAIEFLDLELKKLYDVAVEKMDGIIFITADHGKAECMFNNITGQPNTAHTNNLVPFIFIKKGLENSNVNLNLNLHELSDIAPFILENMGIPVPQEMKK